MNSTEPVIRSDLLFDEMTDGVCISDSRGNMIYMNPAAKRMLEVETPATTLPNACRLLCGRLFAAGSEDCAGSCPLRDDSSHQRAVQFQGRHGPHVLLEWKDGRVERAERWRHLRVRCVKVTSPLWTLGIEERHFILIEDASAAVELAERKEDWRRMAAHDIRSPLTNVLGTLRVLEDVPAGRPLSGEETALVGTAVRSCRRMVELLNLFLDIAELDEGAMPVHAKPAVLRPILRRAEEELGSRIAEKSLSLEIAGAGDPIVLADERLLARVAQNILDNAVKFSPIGGRITLSATRRADGRVEFSVKDEGPGIPLKDQPFIFDRFYQAESRREGRTQGNGLGLTFCRQALAAMGGEIEARSRPGEGTEFVVRLPAGDGGRGV